MAEAVVEAAGARQRGYRQAKGSAVCFRCAFVVVTGKVLRTWIGRYSDRYLDLETSVLTSSPAVKHEAETDF